MYIREIHQNTMYIRETHQNTMYIRETHQNIRYTTLDNKKSKRLIYYIAPYGNLQL